MEPEDVKAVVRATLLVMARIAKRTRSQADDLLAELLKANEARITEAVASLCRESCETPTEEQVRQALERVGIK